MKNNILDYLTSKEFLENVQEVWPHIEKKIVKLNGYGAVYIDFENLWYSILTITEEFINPRDIEETKEYLQETLEEVIDEILSYISFTYKTEVRFVKAYADFVNLFMANEAGVIDKLREKGIETITPYVSGYKDMSDRALIVGVMEDLLHENENLDKIFILTGDIDYYPLFEFISKNYKNEFFIMSFRNRLNLKYEKIFFMKERIIDLDKVFDINSLDKEKNKKFICIKDHIEKNASLKEHVQNGTLNIENTLKALRKHYSYLKFTEQDLRNFMEGR